MKQFFEIRKVDEVARMVWGYASTEAIDSQGETVTKDAMQGAWEDYMQFGNVREMHQPSAVGVVKEYQFDDVGVQIGVYVVDDMAWKKVIEQVYKGFSIGGKKLPGGYDMLTKTITALKLTEISLVDRPANPEALITVWKAEQMENEPMTTKADETSIDKLADLLSKGVISPERLLELADQDVNKVSTETIAATDSDIMDVKTETQKDASVAPVVDTAKSDVPDGDAVTAEPTPLQKSFRLLTATGEDVRKNMYDVAGLSDLLMSLAWLQQDTAWEADMEGDGSSVPVQLAAAVTNLASILLTMAQEEVGELIANLKMPEGSTPLAILTAVVANSETGKDYQKFHESWDVLKAGARNSTADQTLLQKAHDALSELGAVCNDDGAGDDVSMSEKLHKASHEGDIHKALGNVEKMAGDLATLHKAFDTMRTEHAELKKAFASAPATPKGVSLTVVNKGDDISAEAQAAEAIDPVLKQDGSVDEIATAIKKVHAGGGRPLFHKA